MGIDEDILDTTVDTGAEILLDPYPEIEAVLDDLEALLKSGKVVGALTGRGVNASIALCATSGLRAYLHGNKAEAADDFATVADEVRGRLSAAQSDDQSHGRQA